jgi:uncharacterized membrane protein
MSVRTKNPARCFSLISLLALLSYQALSASDSVSLYTPYTIVSLPPGKSMNYSIDVINNGKDIQNVDIYLSGLPRQWTYSISSGSYDIKQLSVMPGGKRTFNLTVEVPLKVNKGNYHFKVVAGHLAVLPLVVNVSEQGTYRTEFTSKQANMQGQAKSNYTFSVELRNRTAETQLYSLRSNAPRGWSVIFKPNYKQATSVEIEPNGTATFNVDVDPPDNIGAGTYKIPLSAVTGSSSADLGLEVVITGTYEMELTTPRGLLSTSVTAGGTKKIELLVRNTGSADLRDIKLGANTPVDWEVTFEPAKIDRIPAGGTEQVMATLKADKKAIAGDYATSLNANSPDASAKAAFRVAVKTPLLWGWVGVIIILAALGSVYYLFRKFGRR